MIDVSGVSFAYQGKRVLHDVSFSVAENSVVALVGPNGAGKTTLMRCLAGLSTPLSGDISMNGIDVLENPRAVHRCTGYLSDFFGLYDNLTVRQSLLNMAWCQKLPAEHIQARVEEVAQLTDLPDYMDKAAGTLSRGYRQRLGVALSIIHKPKILLLDEPASGMDPEARVGLSKLMLRLRDEGMTIVVSSHILAELEDYCTDMLVLRDGRVRDFVAQKKHEGRKVLDIHAKALTLSDKDIVHISTQEHVADVTRSGDDVYFSFAAEEAELAALLKDLTQNGVQIFSFEVKRKSLQSAYMDLADSNKPMPAQENAS